MNTFEAQKSSLTPAQVENMLSINKHIYEEIQADTRRSKSDKLEYAKCFRETNMKLLAELYKKGA
jgi:hypothetical protein